MGASKIAAVTIWHPEGFPSGQRDQTVNLTALPSKVRILLPPPSFKKTRPRAGFSLFGIKSLATTYRRNISPSGITRRQSHAVATLFSIRHQASGKLHDVRVAGTISHPVCPPSMLLICAAERPRSGRSDPNCNGSCCPNHTAPSGGTVLICNQI